MANRDRLDFPAEVEAWRIVLRSQVNEKVIVLQGVG